MTTHIPVSDHYRKAIGFALLLHVPVALFFRLLLDDGQLANLGGYAMVGFWLGVAIIMARRPYTPSAFDLKYIRYGYLPLIFIASLCASLLHH